MAILQRLLFPMVQFMRYMVSTVLQLLVDRGSIPVIPITFEELFSTDTNKSEIIVTFLAVLEMVKLVLVRVVQYVQTGIIRIFYL